MQTEESLKKYNASMMQKIGKMRALSKELNTQYDDDDATKCHAQNSSFEPNPINSESIPPQQPRAVSSLQKEIATLEKAYDELNEILAKAPRRPADDGES